MRIGKHRKAAVPNYTTQVYNKICSGKFCRVGLGITIKVKIFNNDEVDEKCNAMTMEEIV